MHGFALPRSSPKSPPWLALAVLLFGRAAALGQLPIADGVAPYQPPLAAVPFQQIWSPAQPVAVPAQPLPAAPPGYAQYLQPAPAASVGEPFLANTPVGPEAQF